MLRYLRVIYRDYRRLARRVRFGDLAPVTSWHPNPLSVARRRACLRRNKIADSKKLRNSNHLMLRMGACFPGHPALRIRLRSLLRLFESDLSLVSVARENPAWHRILRYRIPGSALSNYRVVRRLAWRLLSL